MLKSYGWVGWVDGPCDYCVSPSPFGLDFGTLDFGTSDSGLTKIFACLNLGKEVISTHRIILIWYLDSLLFLLCQLSDNSPTFMVHCHACVVCRSGDLGSLASWWYLSNVTITFWSLFFTMVVVLSEVSQSIWNVDVWCLVTSRPSAVGCTG